MISMAPQMLIPMGSDLPSFEPQIFPICKGGDYLSLPPPRPRGAHAGTWKAVEPNPSPCNLGGRLIETPKPTCQLQRGTNFTQNWPKLARETSFLESGWGPPDGLSAPPLHQPLSHLWQKATFYDAWSWCVHSFIHSFIPQVFLEQQDTAGNTVDKALEGSTFQW